MKKVPTTILTTVLVFVLFFASFSNTEVKAANYSSTLDDAVVILYHPTVSFTIKSPYSLARDLFGEIKAHYGNDYAAKEGTDVYASADGVVEKISSSPSAGNFIVLLHKDGRRTRYLHLQKALVSEGDKVKVGTVIAKSGSTGKVTGPHLHFEVITKEGKKIDPSTVLVSKRANEVKVPTGYVRITTKAGTVLRFDDKNNLVLAAKNEYDKNQIFEILEEDNKYMFRCLGTGTVMDVANGNSFRGNKVWQFEINYTAAQTFDVVYEPAAEGYYIISSLSAKEGKDMVLDCLVPEIPDTRVVIWDKNETSFDAQIYNFEKVSQADIDRIDTTCPRDPSLYIKINVTDAPSRIRYKKAFNICGNIETLEDIVKVESFIYGKYDNKQKDYTLDQPAASGVRNINIRYSNINRLSDYNKLKRGEYIHKIVVYTSSGMSYAWSCEFTVY